MLDVASIAEVLLPVGRPNDDAGQATNAPQRMQLWDPLPWAP